MKILNISEISANIKKPTISLAAIMQLDHTTCSFSKK